MACRFAKQSVLLVLVSVSGVLSAPFSGLVTRNGASIPAVRGVALNGLLALEDWFFSWPQALPVGEPYPFVEVSSPPDLPQGRRFPSDALPPELIDPWISEGGLLGTTAQRLGANTTVEALTRHRQAYITEYDFLSMSSAGITHVRLPVGWWVFASYPLPQRPSMLADPCYPEKQFVSVSQSMLSTLLSAGARHGIKFLVDMHAMPCGSSDGTYNGIYPADPVFFSNKTAQLLGLRIISNMLTWFKNLEPSLQNAVYAFTLLNEPGLGLVNRGAPGPRPGNTGLPDNTPIVQWLSQAVLLYEQSLGGLPKMPLLYMNLHGSAFPGPDPLDQMGQAASQMGLSNKSWAVFDVHNYFAWEGDGSGIPVSNCSTDEKLRNYVTHQMTNWLQQLKAAGHHHGLVNTACSEWSLSIHHKDFIKPCEAADALSVMYDAQLNAFEQAQVSQFMWGWRMPMGGVHEPMWSLKLHLTGQH